MLGKNGKTKEKIARVSGAELDLDEKSLQLEIRGTDDERKRAKKYVECVMAQRVGPVTIEDNNEDDDLTVIQVPSEAVGFVTGSQGNFLRQVEEEWSTLMFFADFRGRGERQEVTRAACRPPFAPCTCCCRPATRLVHVWPTRRRESTRTRRRPVSTRRRASTCGTSSGSSCRRTTELGAQPRRPEHPTT